MYAENSTVHLEGNYFHPASNWFTITLISLTVEPTLYRLLPHETS